MIVIWATDCHRPNLSIFNIAPSHQNLKSVLSFFRFWEAMFIFPVYSIVFWWFSGKGWDISWHLQMQHNQAKFSDIHFLHGTVAITSTTATITSQPPLSPPPLSQPPLSQPPQLTKASFSHLPLKFLREVSQESFVFTSSTFSSNKSFRETSEPCHVLRLLLILDEQRAPRKTVFQRAMGQRLTDRDCVIFFVIGSLSFGLSFGTGCIKKSAKQWFWETLLLKILTAS